MKAFIVICILAFSTRITFAQIIPNFDFGIKGGINIASLSRQNSFDSDNRSGYLAGIWARVGAMGLHLQPELYYAVKKIRIIDNNGQDSRIQFTSLDFPILVGTKFGAMGIGGHINTGPLISFSISDRQSFGNALGSISRLNYKDQALAWQFGLGLDIKKISVDGRYEYGFSEMEREGFANTKIRLFNLSLEYKLF